MKKGLVFRDLKRGFLLIFETVYVDILPKKPKTFSDEFNIKKSKRHSLWCNLDTPAMIESKIFRNYRRIAAVGKLFCIRFLLLFIDSFITPEDKTRTNLGIRL